MGDRSKGVPRGHGVSGIGVMGCERGLPECSECACAGEVHKVQPPAVLECVVECFMCPWELEVVWNDGVRGRGAAAKGGP